MRKSHNKMLTSNNDLSYGGHFVPFKMLPPFLCNQEAATLPAGPGTVDNLVETFYSDWMCFCFFQKNATVSYQEVFFCVLLVQDVLV